jgi:arginine/serine-rich splicing factor 4/5/6
MADDNHRGYDDGGAHLDSSNGDTGEVIGSAAMRPVFLGNLRTEYATADVHEIFSRPIAPPDTPPGTFRPIPIDRIDLKRGYCFVFLKDATSQDDKDMVERFVSAINGM